MPENAAMQSGALPAELQHQPVILLQTAVMNRHIYIYFYTSILVHQPAMCIHTAYNFFVFHIWRIWLLPDEDTSLS